MNVLVLGDRERTKKFLPDLPIVKESRITVIPIDTPEEGVIEAGADADAVIVDAITPFTANEMSHMPQLKLVHSEGVAFNRIDVSYAKEHGIYVCNQKGANAAAVAEHTVMLMLALLRSVIPGYQNVLRGKQIETKSWLMLHGISELSELKVGLVGFGAIAQETARLLIPFGPGVYYTCRTPKDEKTEEKYHAHYLPQKELLAQCDIISIHVPVTPETEGMCDASFFGQMKNGSYFINTARGEIVGNAALKDALLAGKIIGAGLDTVAPEPVQEDHMLLHLPEEIQRRVFITPHIAGVTTGFFRRAHRTIWENIQRVKNGEEPVNQV